MLERWIKAVVLEVQEYILLCGAAIRACVTAPMYGHDIAEQFELIGIGSLIGSRFARMKTKTLFSHIHAALGSFAIAVAISAIFVAVISLTTPVRFSDIVVAFAPGAMDAMLALALTLHIDPIFVGAHHLSRWLVVTFTLAIFAKSVDREKPQPVGKSWKRPGRGALDD